jgi:hypothetical protein
LLGQGQGLVAGQAQHLLYAAAEAAKPPQTIPHGVNGCRRRRDASFQGLELLLHVGFSGVRQRRQTCRPLMAGHCCEGYLYASVLSSVWNGRERKEISVLFVLSLLNSDALYL